jgi:hypothetical protein
MVLAYIILALCLHHIRKHISCKISGEGMRACCYISSPIFDAESGTWVSFYFYFLHVSSNVSLYVSSFVLSSVSHVVSLPTYFHPFVSSNEIFPPIYLVFYTRLSYMFHIYISQDYRYINQ